MTFYLCFNWDSQLLFVRTKFKKACWILLFNSIFAEVNLPVIFIITINKECLAKHVNNRAPLKIYVCPPGEACLPG